LQVYSIYDILIQVDRRHVIGLFEAFQARLGVAPMRKARLGQKTMILGGKHPGKAPGPAQAHDFGKNPYKPHTVTAGPVLRQPNLVGEPAGGKHYKPRNPSRIVSKATSVKVGT
jgi:hypothetical protein